MTTVVAFPRLKPMLLEFDSPRILLVTVKGLTSENALLEFFASFC